MARKITWLKILTLFSWLILVAHVAHLLLQWSNIPNQIAIHFTNGEADNWGSKYFLLVLPVLGLLTWWLARMLTKNPEKFNYINLTDKNRDQQYKMAHNIMAIHRNLIIIIFTMGNESFLRSAITDGVNESLFMNFMYGTIILMLLVIGYHGTWSFRLKE